MITVCAFAGLGLTCIFVPPPLLPEELAEQQAAQEARRAALRAGQPAQDAEPLGGAPSDSSATRSESDGDPQAGELAPVGMTAEQMQAYATAQGDPLGGVFSLEEALDGLDAPGELWVDMVTTQGVISCRLFEDQTPVTVANFVGLARGLRPALDRSQTEWTSLPYYDGVEFHRVIPGFMIQGGDPTGTGRGRTGYVIEDELVTSLQHDRAGMLSMANRGPGTGSGQFFITLAPVPHLDGKHTVFGRCDDQGIEVAEKIAAMQGPEDRPREPQRIESMTIVRR